MYNIDSSLSSHHASQKVFSELCVSLHYNATSRRHKFYWPCTVLRDSLLLFCGIVRETLGRSCCCLET